MAQILQFPHIARMSKKLRFWRISRIRGNRAEKLGVVRATDDENAIRLAIKQFEVKDPEHQKRLAAMPTDERW